MNYGIFTASKCLVISKQQSHRKGFNEQMISLYARGLSTREIQRHIEEMYKVEISPALISQVTDAVQDEVTLWQSHGGDYIKSEMVRSFMLSTEYRKRFRKS